MKKVEKHLLDPLFQNIGIDIATHNGISYRITTIFISMVDQFETAINTQPVETYYRKRDAIAGHTRYMNLIKTGWMFENRNPR